MLSTKYRLRLESICKDIASGTEVSLEDMIWSNKLAKANTSARGMLSQARRLATDPDGTYYWQHCRKNAEDDIFVDADGFQLELFGSPHLSKDFIMKAILSV